MAFSQTPDAIDGAHELGQLQLAGMALRNGVLVIGPRHWAAAIRRPDGSTQHAVRHRPLAPRALTRLPAVRGPVRLLEMLAVLPQLRRALPGARLPMESRSVLAAFAASSLIGHAVRRHPSHALVELGTGAISLTAMLVALRGSELAQYHGAEHKAIGGYEQGIPAVDASKEHERCGTHLAAPMLVASAVTGALARVLLPRRPATARIAGSLAGIALATEFARSASRRPMQARGGLAGIAASVGTSLQSIASTREPTAAQLEIAEAALAVVLEADGTSAMIADS